MRKNTFPGAAALGIAGIFLAGGVANAGSTGVLSVTDANANTSIRAGDTIHLQGECYDVKIGKLRIESDVFAPVDFTAPEPQDGHRIFMVNVKSGKDAKPGTHKATLKCGTATVQRQFSIVSAGEGTVQPPAKATVTKPTTPAVKPAQVAEKPKGAAETGGGDVVAQAAGSGAPGAGVYALGGAALLATGGAGVVAFRRLRKQG
ncbi:hypothetical protein [Actinocrispum sp. NPDC049592]|uniref:hypothetical protein n=1 Tax=Actinocrispum sp. NPDC049592 TaxID=3154835 RepID=UPI00342D2A34